MTEIKKIYLSKEDAQKLFKYCKGCRYFKPEREPRSICTLISWYDTHNIKDIVEYVKGCPCNKKCLVKAACKEEECPLWKEYVYEALEMRSIKFMKDEKKWKKKSSPASNA